MSVRLRLSIWTSILLATLTISALSQERAARVALVIGNADYPDASTPLPTTINDARTLAGELRRFDFDVEVKEDVRKADMQRAIDAFVGKIGTGTTALFYSAASDFRLRERTILSLSTLRSGARATLRDMASASMQCWQKCIKRERRRRSSFSMLRGKTRSSVVSARPKPALPH